MIVVDASVATKWFLKEEYSEHAIDLLTLEQKLIGPALVCTRFLEPFFVQHVKITSHLKKQSNVEIGGLTSFVRMHSA